MSWLSDSTIFNAIAILSTLVVGIIAYCKWKLSYWDRVGLPTLPATIPFGNAKDMLTRQKTFGEQFRHWYQEFKRKGYTRHGGIYVGTKPFYMIIDLELLKHVMQKDFQHFVNHGIYLNERDDPLSGNLFNLEDAKWRDMRVKLTPTFTSGKMKMMFQTMADCTVGLQDLMNVAATDDSPVDIKEILGRFTTDIIGSAGFGLECNSLKDPNAVFRKYGKRLFDNTVGEVMKIMVTFVLPHSLLRKLKYTMTKPDCNEFFMKVIQDTVNYREQNNIYRKDFMHLLLQLKNRGTVADDDKITDGQIQEKALTMNELAAQAFVFFAAGFETSSTLMTFALYELATNNDVQEKLREEINSVLAKHNTMSYDALMEMKYMDNVLSETLRKHPPVPFLLRKCTQDYIIPDTNMVVKKGIDVAIPVLGIHRDPEYYPDPEKFDPERFSEENKKTRPHYSWIPFGEGPRICIGLRFGLMQSKVGLTTLLKNYRITLNKKTSLPLMMDKTSFIASVDGGVWLNVEKIK